MWHHGGGWELMGGWGWGPGLHGGFLWLLLLVLVVIAMVWLMRPSNAIGARNIEARSRGLDVLGERYARGEVGRDEYLQRRRDILG